MITSTFTLLRKADACAEGYKKLAVHLGGVRKYGVSTDIPVTVKRRGLGWRDARV